MRPIDRQAAPRVYARYEDALRDLADRIGEYCSYCERYIETHLAVEHIQPKSRKKSLRTAWTNFLLACVNCNSCKGKRHVVLNRFFWPDVDNTLRCFAYVTGGRVVVTPGLGIPDTAKAQASIKLVGLDRDPGHPVRKRRPTCAGSGDKRHGTRPKRIVQSWLIRQRIRLICARQLPRRLQSEGCSQSG